MCLPYLERGSHLAVELVLLLRDLDVVLGRLLHRERQVGVHVPPVGKPVAAKSDLKMISQVTNDRVFLLLRKNNP